MLGALAQGIGPTGLWRRLSILGVWRVTNVDTGAILAILLFLAVLVSSTAWQAFATMAYLSSILAITVAFAHWLFWWGI